LEKILDCSKEEQLEFSKSIRKLDGQQPSSIKQPLMKESARLEEWH